MNYFKLFTCIYLFFVFNVKPVSAQKFSTGKLLYGVAYYDEYMPAERLDKDVAMMKAAGINVVRIAESTWSTLEPREGEFNFTHIDRVLQAMNHAGIKVIIGTPTYAIPAWLAAKHPDVLVTTSRGQVGYGTRQNMDITNEHYLKAAERIIRKLLEHVKDHPAVIGYQLDNETKAYGTAGPNVQKLFVLYCKQKFQSLDTLNKIWGLDYWSNRINSWDEFPSTNGTINASMAAEFAKFQRKLVTDFLAWQNNIVAEYKRPEQFTTQNFDLGWKGHSFGVQPEVDHFAAAAPLDVAGIDIYHPSQDELTGVEISFGGDMTRSMKGGKNYLVLETEAQGFPEWVPYPGQLRLQAFSHLASGANMVEYWHWHSIHNSAETYWKGLLSHDFSPNATYNEAKVIGKEFERLSPHLINLKKNNEVAILFSNEALTAFSNFSQGMSYNDILRSFYDAFYRMNVGTDLVDPSSKHLEKYKLIVVPALYAAPDSLLRRLNNYVKNGGHIIYSFRSGFSDENVKVRSTRQPGVIAEACGIGYDQFTIPKNVGVRSSSFDITEEDAQARQWIELITPTTAKVLAYYKHPVWGKYAAITENQFGKGKATYIGFMPSQSLVSKIIDDAVKKAQISRDSDLKFPLISKSGMNEKGKQVHFYFNYSATPKAVKYFRKTGRELLSDKDIATNSSFEIGPWDLKIIEEN
ncbi:beta-galactosidase [Mucilaginibacter sp. UR6-1]|uniref:beta-galactosidase n=1 Tax=Mucilaginibacter sp. UR6-1 TaxID=1435643 RepID=UPI001E51802B|nr:beta-galactosidase [Mucilaginibacter sp. UR6-1]MCC8409458.1 beta-galactosidase [Mucilaginibacter sp. UR6-1]